MGIPSYFRRILQKYSGVLSHSPPANVKALCFDFNCLVYRCLSQMPEYSHETHDSWEDTLLHRVEQCVKEIYEEASRPPQVYIAVDGVVPMAKIRQQRVRRFKSAWLRAQESGERWDTNSITPGTVFMNKLTTKLETICEKHRGWELSSVQQPGEGEHKILQWLRSGKLKEKGSVVVYGLDADLILLTMLVGEQLDLPMYLLREKQEFGVKGSSTNSEAQLYQFMNIRSFQDRLGVKGYSNTLNYIGVMSLMGNDFLPHSITHKLNDDGHDYVLRSLGNKIVNDKGELNLNNLKFITKKWAETEETKLLGMIKKKKEQAQRGVLEGMSEQEGLPLQWMVEKEFVEGDSLREIWKDIYYGFQNKKKEDLCLEYVKGCQWILDYYSGKDVDKNWMFPSWIPPLWSDLSIYKFPSDLQLEKKPFDILPEEQLAMVLPLDSWDLVKKKELRRLPTLLPQLWPVDFSFFSLGRRWLWECEALVPPISAERLRSLVRP